MTDYDIIKEYVETEHGITCIIRANVFCKHFDYFLALIEEAKKDFDLTLADIEVVKFAGCRYAQTHGIFFRPHQPLPKSYIKLECFEARY